MNTGRLLECSMISVCPTTQANRNVPTQPVAVRQRNFYLVFHNWKRKRTHLLTPKTNLEEYVCLFKSYRIRFSIRKDASTISYGAAMNLKKENKWSTNSAFRFHTNRKYIFYSILSSTFVHTTNYVYFVWIACCWIINCVFFSSNFTIRSD